MSTQQTVERGSAPCSACGAALAEDQRYCLECGERRAPATSAFLSSGQAGPASTQNVPAPVAPPSTAPPAAPQSTTLTVIAGVGVLLLAIGVGVLIGRAGGPKGSGSAQVITVASQGAGTAPASSSSGGEASFTSDWSATKTGFTVELQTLPAGASLAAVQAAKSAAEAKGAKNVGALKAEEFSSLGGSGYVVYSGDFRKRAEAQHALAQLKRSFGAAKVVEVSGKAAGPSAGAEPASGGKGVGESINHPAPPTVLKSLQKVKGKSYEERSKNLPNVISTG